MTTLCRGGRQSVLHLYIDKNALSRDKKLISNLSGFAEMKLREHTILVESGLREKNDMGPPGFEPETFASSDY